MMKKLFYLILFLIPGIACAKPVLDIQQWQTSNGAGVYFVQSTAVPMIDVAVVFNAGSIYDGDHPGLAMLTNAMFAEATDNSSADDIATRFAQVGAIFGNDASRSMALISFRSLTDPQKLVVAVNTFTAVLTRAQFPNSNYQRIQQQVLMALKGEEQDPDSIADNLLLAKVFGDSPYAHDPYGTVDSVSKIDTNDIKAFYEKYYVAHNAFVVIVGDVSKAQAQDVAEDIMSYLPAGHAAAPVNVPDNVASSATQVNFPSSQNQIRLGLITIDRNNPNYFPLMVGNYILGSGFTSRLFQEVRNKRGLSYYIGSTLMPLPDKSLFLISLQTKNSSSQEALNVTKTTLSNYIKQGPTNDELDNAKRSINGAFPLRFDSNSAILSQVINVAFFHLPLNYYDTYRAKIDAVTPEQVIKAFQQYIKLNELSVVSVGGKQFDH